MPKPGKAEFLAPSPTPCVRIRTGRFPTDNTFLSNHEDTALTRVFSFP